MLRVRALRVPSAESGSVLRVHEETPAARVRARSVARVVMYFERSCGLVVVRGECERGGSIGGLDACGASSQCCELSCC